jgi:hypothetical protein
MTEQTAETRRRDNHASERWKCLSMCGPRWILSKPLFVDSQLFTDKNGDGSPPINNSKKYPPIAAGTSDPYVPPK